ncbi:hypothetical protein [Burkholderia ubonensis]|uniref:hypothetical protein n=1 Tax=Burkholderia ubonensis TaxID=101571 RepID=UPI000A9F334B|nr:hypothetical protein [Burkholderia ubonensis]
MTREEFDRLWDSRQFDKIWNRDRAIAALEQMATFPNGNKFTRAAARRELQQVLDSPCQPR